MRGILLSVALTAAAVVGSAALDLRTAAMLRDFSVWLDGSGGELSRLCGTDAECVAYCGCLRSL